MAQTTTVPEKLWCAIAAKMVENEAFFYKLESPEESSGAVTTIVTDNGWTDIDSTQIADAVSIINDFMLENTAHREYKTAMQYILDGTMVEAG